MYQQIADDLRKQIDSGVLGRGCQLPTELELRERYDASRNTVRDAIKRLTCQGLVETRPGQGTFVTMKDDPFVTILTREVGGHTSGFGGSYLRGELSGSFSLLDRIANSLIAVTGDESDDGSWQRGIRTGFSYSHELSGYVLEYPSFAELLSRPFAGLFSRIWDAEPWGDDYVLSAFSERQRSAAQLLIRYSAERVELLAAALVRLLAIILIVAAAILFAVRSVFRFATAATIIVRMLMAHRNSREPAYSPTSRLPLYQSLAGVALAQ